MLQGGKSEKYIACCNTQIPVEDPYPSIYKEFRKLFHVHYDLIKNIERRKLRIFFSSSNLIVINSFHFLLCSALYTALINDQLPNFYFSKLAAIRLQGTEEFKNAVFENKSDLFCKLSIVSK